jgi:S-adenosylmethionine:tRNA ribosyltransferase-isomerase
MMKDLSLSNYDFNLPPELIADRPVPDRHSSRLMVYNEATGEITHTYFTEIDKYLPENSAMVFNQSKVFPCRLRGHKTSGGEAEVFILSLLHQNNLYPAMIKASGKRKVGDEFHFGELIAILAEVSGDGTFLVKFNKDHDELLTLFEEIGKIPIPPYIRGGESDENDKKTYQTVYAKSVGSVAAPTAGLHFSEELLGQLAKKHPLAFVTLHVGAGTFAPIKVENLLEHKMHEEFFSIDPANLKIIQENRKNLVAVGTTTLRSLESAWDGEKVSASEDLQGTSIFLHPGKEVHSIRALVTNFHLPKSSLLMLVSALIGREKTLELYDTAIKNKYRFFSYGDGMLILRK